MRLYDYAASGNCYKVRLLLALLGRDDVERVETDIFAGATLTDEYARINPLREVPVLELDDGTTIAQSSAILWYLGEGTPFLPATALGRARVVQWLSFEQERVMGGLGGARFRRLTGRPERPGQHETGVAALGTLDDHLAGRDWLVGDAPTIADVGVYAYTHPAPEIGVALPPHVAAWCARIAALPGYVHDLLPYPDAARPGAGRSVYD